METSTTLVLGYSCNNKCIFCLYGDEKGMRPLEDLKKSLDDLRKLSDKVMLTGGSEFREDYLEILKYAKNLGFSIHIDTNARVFADMEFAREVFKICPDAVFSTGLHAPVAEIHDEITQVKGSWEETVAGLRNIIELGFKWVDIVSVICKMNYKILPEITEFAKGLGVSQHHFVLVRKEGRAEKIYPELLPSIHEFKPYLMKAIEKAEKLNLPVKVYGLPLCIIKPKYSFELGAVNASKIIWDLEGEKNDELKGRNNIRIKFPKCKKCRYFYVCMGPLKAYTEVYGGNEFMPVEGKYIRTLQELKHC